MEPREHRRSRKHVRSQVNTGQAQRTEEKPWANFARPLGRRLKYRIRGKVRSPNLGRSRRDRVKATKKMSLGDR